MLRSPKLVIVRSVAVIFLAVLFTGCSGGGGGGTPSNSVGASVSSNSPNSPTQPNLPTSPPAPTATIQVRHTVLARELPSSISHLRFFGTTPSGEVVYGPVVKVKAPEILLSGVPLDVVRLRIEYLEGEIVRGLYLAPCTLVGGDTFVIDDPPFENVLPQLRSLSLSPAQLEVPAGQSMEVQVFGTFDDGQRQDLTATVTWDVQPSEVAEVSGGLLQGLRQGTAQITARFGDTEIRRQVVVTPAVLTQITIIAQNVQIPHGEQLQLAAEGLFSDGSSRELTQVEWRTSDESIAVVDEQGLLQTQREGEITVTARRGEVEGSRLFTVTEAQLRRLEMELSTEDLPVGLERQAKCYGLYSDGTRREVTTYGVWTVSPVEKAVISVGGLVTARAEGPLEVKCAFGGLETSRQLTVAAPLLQSLEILPPELDLPKGMTSQLTALGHFSDGSTSFVSNLMWESSAPETLQVDSEGNVHGSTVGTAVVTGRVSNGISATSEIEVTPAVLEGLLIEPQTLTLPAGLSSHVRVTALMSDDTLLDVTQEVAWSSSDVDTALVDTTLDSPRVKTVREGAAVLTAHYKSLKVELPVTVLSPEIESLTIEPPVEEMPTEARQQFEAFAHLSDGRRFEATKDVVWSVSDNRMARFGDVPGYEGSLLTDIRVGELTVTAYLPSADKTANHTFLIRLAKLVSIYTSTDHYDLAVGQRAGLTVYGRFDNGKSRRVEYYCRYRSSDSRVGLVGGLKGSEARMEARKEGQFTIFIQSYDGVAEHQVEVTVRPVEIKQIGLASESHVNTAGYLQAPAQTVHKFRLLATYTDDRRIDITEQAVWQSSDPLKVLVETGQATVLSGEAEVQAHFGGQIYRRKVQTVEDTLQSLSFSLAKTSLPQLASTPIRVNGHYQTRGVMNLTDSVSLSSSNSSVVSIEQTENGERYLLARGVGSALIHAVHAATGKESEVRVYSTGQNLVALSFDQGHTLLKTSSQRRLVAMGHFSDGSRHDLTQRVGWRVAQSTTPQVVGALSSDGRLTTGSQEGVIQVEMFDPHSPTSVTCEFSVSNDHVTESILQPLLFFDFRSSSDSESFYALHEYGVKEYSVPGLEVLQEVSLEKTSGFELSPDGMFLWVSHRESGKVTRLSTADLTSQTTYSIPDLDSIRDVSVDSTRVYVLADETVVVFDPATNSVKGTYQSRNLSTGAMLAKSPNSPTLLVAHSYTPSKLDRFEISNDRLVLKQSLRNEGSVRGIKVNPNGEGFFHITPGGNSEPDLGQGYRVHYYNMNNINEVFSSHLVEGAYPSDGAFSPDGFTGYSMGGEDAINANHPRLALVHLLTGEKLGTVPIDFVPYGAGPVKATISNDGTYLLIYIYDTSALDQGAILQTVRLR